jgi:hypothetical protein
MHLSLFLVLTLAFISAGFDVGNRELLNEKHN